VNRESSRNRKFTIHCLTPSRAWWLAGLILAVVPIVATAQVRFGFGFRYRNAPYDGRVALMRARYQAYPGWSYDYPAMENNLARVLHDITSIRPNLEAADILDFDDPQLFRYPLVYLSEPGYWYPTPTEAEGLRTYLQKGGFLIVDDFHYPNEWAVFEAAMRRVLPAARIYRLDATHSIYNTFFAIKSLDIPYPGMSGPNALKGEFFGIYQDNDPQKDLIVVINYNMDLGDYLEWSADPGNRYSLVPTNEAYKFLINYVLYGLTH
jgi:hypothetical protein